MAEQRITTDTPFPKQYAREVLTLKKGKGSYVKDTEGRRYLDFGAGIAVNALGYGRRDLARSAARQMRRLIHVSNLYTTEPTLEFARRILESAREAVGGDYQAVHFGNSGTEANEAALKYARLYAATRDGEHHRFLSFSHGFHGRTMGGLSVTANQKHRKKFEPLIPGCEYAPYNDVEALESTLDGRFAAVIVEAVQGEGGLTTMTEEFAQALNRLCAEHDVLLIADEVQTGLGRTGTLFGSERVGLKPDIITLSKPLGGGLPLSATVLPGKVNDRLELGDHGTTFGGGPVTTGVGLRVWERISQPKFLEEVRGKADHLERRLGELQSRFPFIEQIKGAGMLRGLALHAPADRVGEIMKSALKHARERGLLVLKSGDNVIRIAPPLVITQKELDRGCEMLADTLSYLQNHYEGALA